MGKSYTYVWEGHYKEKSDKRNQHHVVYGMTISEIIKTLINLYNGKVSQFTIRIWHQTRPFSYPVRELKISQDFPWNDDLKYIHDIYRNMGLDYNKPISRRYYELKIVA